MTAARVIIRCPDSGWSSDPLSPESAERRLAGIIAGGNCPHEHQIVSVDQEAPMGTR